MLIDPRCRMCQDREGLMVPDRLFGTHCDKCGWWPGSDFHRGRWEPDIGDVAVALFMREHFIVIPVTYLKVVK
jgi:hypothetical protein